MTTRWLKVTLAYDGGAYAGWQVQPDKPTVQGTLEAALRQITQEPIRVTAAGRTDAGVHALGQVAGFATATRLKNAELQRALNAVLPSDVAVVSLEDAPTDFHATRDAVAKRYRYQIHNGRTPSVFDRHYAWHYPQPLDAAAMHAAGQALVGRHDFSSFETAGSERSDSIRTIRELSVTRGSEELADRVTIEVAGDGFLYNMVRTIVGTLVEVGVGARDVNWPAAVLAACDRRQAGQTAPPHGLFLVSVSYENSDI
ncbi:MAG TPA: tRNA pseudouridine(38-40) synthase TruA [Lacipirellulaceae bacterium]|nr:tRNA pseudouridine(38-40) synthase TruA [Lacipirellulaceae bacterium]